MIDTLAGLIVLLLPFLLWGISSPKKGSFETLLITSMAAHLVIGVGTQLFGTFSRTPVLVGSLLFLVGYGLYTRPSVSSVRSVWLQAPKHTQSIMVYGILIGFSALYLYTAHFSYTGQMSYLSEPTLRRPAPDVPYPYPQYADEWYAVAFMKQSIESGSLPLGNPLTRSVQPFPNLEIATHSLLSEIVVLLDLDPLRHYLFLSIGANTLILLLIFRYLRTLQVAIIPALITTLSALFIVSGANLPGLWTLIPLTLGIIPMTASLRLLAVGTMHTALKGVGLSLIFYPPLAVVLLPMTYAYIWQDKRKKLFTLSLLCTCALVASLLTVTLVMRYSFEQRSVSTILSYIGSTLFYENFTEGSIARLNPFYILPITVVVGVILSTASLTQRRYRPLIIGVAVGSILWGIYSVLSWQFVIGYQRIVIVTSLLLTILTGIGYNTFYKHIEKRMMLPGLYVQLAAFSIIALVLLPGYTTRERWKELVLVDDVQGSVLQPAAPKNRYLTPEDETLFTPLSGATFLSIPWKGTVIGIATDTIPITTKPGTITLNPEVVPRFIDGTCHIKRTIARRYEIEYVYLPPFQCAGFKHIGESSEGLYLYKVNRTKILGK